MDGAVIFVILIVWLIIAAIVGSMGEDRKIGSAGAFWASLLLSPIVGLLFVIASDKIERPMQPVSVEGKFNPRKHGKNELDRVDMLINMCNDKIQKKDFNGAVYDMEEALKTCPGHHKVLFNLACLYSIKLMPDESLKYLKQAVAKGYDNFDKIKQDHDLTSLRQTDGYKAFEAKGFSETLPPSPFQPEETAVPIDDKYTLLERIGKLKESGVLTQEEFEKEKEKILSAK